MSARLDNITKHILSLHSISEDNRSTLINDVHLLEKEMNEDNFMIKRLAKDKSIGFNILKATIADLKKSRIKIEAANQQLLEQQDKLKEQQKVIKLNAKNLRENLKKLKHSYHELENFSHIASHDLKSPLRSISGFAHLLQKKYTDKINAEADQFLSFIVSSANHMHEIIESLLEYSKVGIKQKDFEKVNLNDIAKLVEKNLSIDIKEHHVKIVWSNLPTINGDKICFLQLFQNLIGNAIKFRSDSPPFIQVNCKKNSDVWKFDVIDNGIGLDESFQENAFFPFQKYAGKSKIGTGLGLAICKKIISLFEGHIYYNKNDHNGTTFSFEIPSYYLYRIKQTWKRITCIQNQTIQYLIPSWILL